MMAPVVMVLLVMLWPSSGGATTQIRRSICVSFHAADDEATATASDNGSPCAANVSVRTQISHNPKKKLR